MLYDGLLMSHILFMWLLISDKLPKKKDKKKKQKKVKNGKDGIIKYEIDCIIYLYYQSVVS